MCALWVCHALRIFGALGILRIIAGPRDVVVVVAAGVNDLASFGLGRRSVGRGCLLWFVGRSRSVASYARHGEKMAVDGWDSIDGMEAKGAEAGGEKLTKGKIRPRGPQARTDWGHDAPKARRTGTHWGLKPLGPRPLGIVPMPGRTGLMEGTVRGGPCA